MSTLLERSIEPNTSTVTRWQQNFIRERYISGRDRSLEILGVKKINRWLDIGPYINIGPQILDEANFALTCIDLNLPDLNQGIRNVDKATAAVVDSNNLSFPESTFDVISVFEVLEHVDQYKQK